MIIKGKKVPICVKCAIKEHKSKVIKFVALTNVVATEKTLQMLACPKTAKKLKKEEIPDCDYTGQGDKELKRLDNWWTSETNLTFAKTKNKEDWIKEQIQKVRGKIENIQQEMQRTSSLKKRENFAICLQKAGKRVKELSKNISK